MQILSRIDKVIGRKGTKDTEERPAEAGGDAGAREALSRHRNVRDQIYKTSDITKG